MKLRCDRKILLIAAVCLLIEIFVCNANSFRVLNGSKYEKKSYTVDQMETSGFEVTGNILTYVADYGQEASITLKNIDTCVGTVYLNLYLPNESFLKYTLYYTDEANGYLMRSVPGEYVPAVDHTKWMTCHFAGESSEIKIVFDLEDDLYQMAVDGCVINEPVKFNFRFGRFLAMLLIAVGMYAVRKKRYFDEAFSKRSQAVLLGAAFAGFVLLCWNLYANSVPEVSLCDTEGDIYSQYLTDALIGGRTKLDLEPSEAFLELHNPYDYTEREFKGLERDVDYVWDIAWYDGAYYVYFGVIPALLLFVPFKLATGMYLSTGFTVFLFFCIYLLFLDLLLIRSIKKVLPDTPFGLYLPGMVMLNAASGALWFMTRARFYEMAYATGLALSAAGLYLLASCAWKERWNYVKIFFGGLFLAFAVGCRPTMVLYSFLLVPYLWKMLRKKPLKGKILPLAVLAVPYICVAAVLMRYNYARFGSVFDFGQNYQLTMTDMAKNSYDPATLPWCLWLGMFQPLSITSHFPFVSSGSAGIDFAGYFYNSGDAVPMFSAVPLLYLMFVPTLWKRWREQTGSFSTVMLGTVLGGGWLMAVLVFISAGVHLRYTAEAVPLLTFAVILLSCNYIRMQDGKIRQNLITGFFALALFSLLAAFLIGIVGEQNWIYTNHPEFYYLVERAFCFWK